MRNVGIAIIQLYLEEKWIEPIQSIFYPFSLLYHQTLSIIAAHRELSPTELKQKVLSLPSFRLIAEADFLQILSHLIKIDHLQLTETGNLIIGITGSKIVRNFNFYAVFDAQIEYKVKNESGEIGSISIALSQGSRFALAGRTWEVIEVDLKRKTLFVKFVEGIGSISWRGNSQVHLHSKILQRMQQVLAETNEYSYLQKAGQKRLQKARQLAKNFNLNTKKNYSFRRENLLYFSLDGN